ncbi:hypothetical protein IV203_002956 [Nitzschia inconspicua]|uniref:Uncharacterized protein n=1 Tax=Nitzschia inconspicua TaxID=303405 RepID=A0A9K3L2I2_9STRA|nr:hypothetical protein IV203_002956 [Nitzschia inconspicua]
MIDRRREFWTLTVVLVIVTQCAFGFAPSTSKRVTTPRLSQRESPFLLGMASKRTITKTDESQTETTTITNDGQFSARNDENAISILAMATTSTALTLSVIAESANAAITMPKELSATFDPNTFVPVCGASDTFYRFLQSTAQTVVGRENFIEYGPLIASGLLRVRLELCVVESFFNEAVGPFIRQNGLSWVLPLHETVETFLAGTVFALATTFILVGSTKILTVIFTYADFLLGAPCRLLGGFFFDRARGKPVTLDVGFGPFKTRVIGPKDIEATSNPYDYSVDLSETSPGELPVVVISGGVKAAGQAIGLVREVLDAIDLFVGKSLILWVTAYVGIKFIHFKVFPDFP